MDRPAARIRRPNNPNRAADDGPAAIDRRPAVSSCLCHEPISKSRRSIDLPKTLNVIQDRKRSSPGAGMNTGVWARSS